MKRTAWTLFFSLVIAAPLLADDSTVPVNASASATQDTNSASAFTNEKQRASYALGMMIGHNWQQQGVDVDFDIFARGFKDTQSGKPTLMTAQQMQETLRDYQKVIMAKQEEKRKALAEENKMKSAEFLAANAKKPGVKVLKDGLQYKIITEGNGSSPGSNDMVTVNYRGSLIDGTEFDSSYKRGQPAEFSLNRIIPGWREALQMMKPGAVWELYIPSDLAYGEMGRPPQIPGNATLIFNVQLISSTPPKPPAPSASQPLTSDIIAVPSAAELKKGKQPYTLTPEQVEKLQKQYGTNQPAK